MFTECKNKTDDVCSYLIREVNEFTTSIRSRELHVTNQLMTFDLTEKFFVSSLYL